MALSALSAALLCGASPAAAEHLASPALDGFVVGHEAENAEQMIREEVPSGETVAAWTRMVTTQRFGGAAARHTPSSFLETVASNLAAACPGASASRILASTRNGRPAARMRAYCPLFARTGEPEAFIMLAITGEQDLHVKQVAFRREPTDDDVAWGEAVLAAVTYCATGATEVPCAP